METYDKSYDRVTTKSERRLLRVNRIFHKVTTTDDPIIRQVEDLSPICFRVRFYITFCLYKCSESIFTFTVGPE